MYYENLAFDRLAAIVNIADDKSFHKTIHKAKGDEFKNVLVISSENSDNKQLDFLLSPDMSKEEHRVFYVALSRAEEKLFINVPTLSEENIQKLVEFDVIKLES